MIHSTHTTSTHRRTKRMAQISRLVATLGLLFSLGTSEASATQTMAPGFHAGQGVAAAGVTTAIVGPIAGFSVAVSSMHVAPLVILGGGSYLIGNAMMIGGGFLARSQVIRSGHEVPAWPITASAALIVVTPVIFASSLGAPGLGVLSIATYLTGCGFGIGQIVANAKGARWATAYTSAKTRRRVRWDLVVLPGGQVGINGSW
jgi:hypothetical protein